MIQLPLERTPRWAIALRGVGLGLSIAFHGALAWWAMQDRPEQKREETWVEMTVVETKPPPPPPPPPPPEPEPEKPKPKPRPVDFAETVKETPKDAPPPEAAPERKVRRVQGLSASSFAQGSGSGLDARAGTTLGTRATSETLSVDEAKEFVPFAAATTQPRFRYGPPIQTPATLKTECKLNVLLDLDVEGRVVNVVVIDPGRFGPEVDQACISAWKKARFSPGKQGDQPVPVTRVPQTCEFKIIE